ncbi:hypothetical protein [Streptomyces sp. ODS28]|uniref:hypothetical protein n=1 Tax=Streptomyces sp. ODS28 TaxID=3136688 RepID=UPI0031EC2BD2
MGPLDALPAPLLAVLAAVPALGLVARVWIGHRTAVRLARERTEQVRLIVTGTADGPAELVRACAELEAASRTPAAAPRTGRRGRAAQGP